MIVYVDNENKCHVENAPNRVACEVAAFDGKCKEFVEGYLYVKSDTQVSIYPWKPWRDLDAAQRDYERQLIAEYEQALSEVEAALGVSG